MWRNGVQKYTTQNFLACRHQRLVRKASGASLPTLGMWNVMTESGTTNTALGLVPLSSPLSTKQHRACGRQV